jgi:hypothetical protein
LEITNRHVATLAERGSARMGRMVEKIITADGEVYVKEETIEEEPR